MACLELAGPDLESLPTPKGVVALANEMLAEFNIPTRLEDVSDISAALFVVLYESLFSDRLPGIVRQPVSREDEIHNIQTVIDVLSTDVVRDNLSHIRGVDIVTGNITSISNLLDIFHYLLEYVVKKIESDLDHNDTKMSEISNPDIDKEDLSLTKTSSEFSKEIKTNKVSKSKNYSSRTQKYEKAQSASLNKNENRKAFDEHPVISHEEYFAMTNKTVPSYHFACPPSPIKADQSESLLGQKTIDSEFEDEKSQQHVNSSKHSQFLQEPATSPCIDTFLLKEYNMEKTCSQFDERIYSKPSVVSTKSSQFPTKKNMFENTTYTNKDQNIENPVKESSSAKPLSQSYENLSHMVEKTAAMTRLALLTSPVFSRGHYDPISNEQELYFKSVNEQRHNLPSSTQPPNSLFVKNDERKHVAFSSLILPDGINHRSEEVSSKKSDAQVKRQTNRRGIATAKTKQSAAKTCKKTKSLSLNEDFGAAHDNVIRNNRTFKEKQEILRDFYQKDHEEFTEEVDDILGKKAQKVQAQENELVRQLLQNCQKKKNKTKKTPLKKPEKCKQKKIEKVQSSPEGFGATPSFSIDGDENLLSSLIEEFPYLHLSDHSWHELWRRGFQQIEALTRSYQENLKKKSRAQIQLAEAAERHQMLGDIMRKQIDHSKRMNEIKEQKIQQIKLKNKMHDKRIQSARARRYYNEYHVRTRAKQLKKRTKEEMVFRELFKTALNIQKERLKDIRQYAADCHKRQEKRRQNEIESIENFYHDQFQMLTERLSKEKIDTGVREMAQQQMLERVKRELRKKMESEIKQYQEQIFTDDDNVHYRQRDADRVKQQMQSASFTAKV